MPPSLSMTTEMLLGIRREQHASIVNDSSLLTEKDKTLLTRHPFSGQQAFYLLLVDAFRPLFLQIELRDWSCASISCFLGWMFARHFDYIQDDSFPVERRPSLQRCAAFYHQTCFEHLALLFPKQHPFWRNLNLIYGKFFHAMDFEIELGSHPSKVSLDSYWLLAIGKSALAASVPSILCHLTGCFTYQQRIEDSLSKFHAALAVIDDLEDIHEDIAAGRINYFVVQGVPLLRGHGISIDPAQDSQVFVKYLCVTGVVSAAHRTVIGLLQEAQDVLPEGDLSLYSTYLSSLVQTQRESLDRLEQLVTVALTNVGSFNHLVAREAGA